MSPPAQAQAADGALVRAGRTVLDPGDMALNVPARRWGNLGIPASDAGHGLSLDIFLVQDTVPAAAGEVLGFSGGIKLRSQGGILEGAGREHALVFSLFDTAGQPHPVGLLTRTLAHELGHSLSLLHTTELNFQPGGGGDDCSGTQVSTAAHDTNGNGALDPSDSLQACPDFSNLMFTLSASGGQTMLTAQQATAIRSYLAIRRH